MHVYGHIFTIIFCCYLARVSPHARTPELEFWESGQGFWSWRLRCQSRLLLTSDLQQRADLSHQKERTSSRKGPVAAVGAGGRRACAAKGEGFPTALGARLSSGCSALGHGSTCLTADFSAAPSCVNYLGWACMWQQRSPAEQLLPAWHYLYPTCLMFHFIKCEIASCLRKQCVCLKKYFIAKKW